MTTVFWYMCLLLLFVLELDGFMTVSADCETFHP
jgi:hypothetical protein